MFFFLLIHFFQLSPAFESCIANPEDISFYYKHQGQPIRYLDQIQKVDPKVKFAMNIQMYAYDKKHDPVPVGLYIENGKQVNKLWIVNNPKINFGMQPQCVFAITKQNKALMVQVKDVKIDDYKSAVELAPMIVVNGKINPQLTRSNNKYIRNAVGILKDGRVLFAISKEPVTFQQLADYFLSFQCVNASYIDGAVSEIWKPGDISGFRENFAVMVGVK